MRLMEAMKARYEKITNMQPGVLLSQVDAITLKNKENKPLTHRRKITYKKWFCSNCSHEFFYIMRSCVLCESANVKEVKQVT